MIKRTLTLEKEGKEYVAQLQLCIGDNITIPMASIRYSDKPSIHQSKSITIPTSKYIEIGDSVFWADEFEDKTNDCAHEIYTMIQTELEKKKSNDWQSMSAEVEKHLTRKEE